MAPLCVRLRQLRNERGLSQEQLAELIGARQATISNLESGRTTRIEFSLLERLCRALGVQTGDILEYIPDRPRGRS